MWTQAVTKYFPFTILLLGTMLAAGCTLLHRTSEQSRSSSASTQSQEDPSGENILSPEASAAFEALTPIALDDGEGMRIFHIDASQSRAAYVVDEELFADATRKYGLAVGKTKVVGETQDLEGLVQIDPTGPLIGAGHFAVYLPSLQTDQNLRDAWIRDNALESNRFPLAILVAGQLGKAPKGYREGELARFQLFGDLTMRGITLPTVWEVSATLQEDTIEGSLQTRLRMTDLGFSPPNFANTLSVQNEFTVRIDFVARAQ